VSIMIGFVELGRMGGNMAHVASTFGEKLLSALRRRFGRRGEARRVRGTP
jgi:hypothetical protein